MEKQAIIDRLEENKSKCPAISMFGGDNHRALDIMIEVVQDDLSQGEIYDKYEGDDLDSANSAREVLDGSTDIEDILYPED